ncbi:arginase [Paludicola sp. MB14-C6]|uniref:arginase n=1 Tax=Paludihabitans sp. MB14-C6 TaxID=3070656 RepID=UPI0027DD18DE|nr:arginase [Paludicola sp. MB14-C6]WMJ22219.1 arginase [Paludicola sp. MB14-C6]
MYELIGCPMHLGVSNKGLQQSINSLNVRYPDLNIKKIDEIIVPEENLKNLKNLNSVVATCTSIAKETNAIAKRGNIPLFVGGDHASAIGTISGVANNVKGLGLIWVDAHSDINTDVSTISGNIHGMPVSVVMGYGEEKLVNICEIDTKILPQNIVLFGVRDMDPLEKDIVERLNIKVYTYHEVIERGLEVCLKEAKDYLSNITKLHISFDLDVMNPELIKGVSVPVKDGFNEQEVDHIFDFLLEEFPISSIDIVEYNPICDTDLHTAEFTYSLIQKILDK